MLRALVICLPLMVACNDYGFSTPDDADVPGGDKDGDTGSSGEDDTGPGSPGDSDDPPGNPGDDECYDPDAAYDMHPAAGLVVTQPLELVVAYQGSDAGYTSELYLESPYSLYLGTGHQTAPGTATSLGVLPPGAELIFSIRVTDNGNVFYSGPASRNTDGFNHAAITYAGECVWVVGFEDEYGGGDQDFNDIELTITGPLEMQLVE